MMIDERVPRILAARGLSRRQIAAGLRVICSDKAYKVEDACHVIEHALGCPYFSPGVEKTWRIPQCDIAIAKGVRLVIAHCGYNDSKTGIFVDIDGKIPAGVAISLQGEALRKLVDHPLLDGDAIIESVRTKEGRTMVDIEMKERDISIMIPASQRDMDIARMQWRLMRSRDAWRAGAVEGLSFNVARKAIIRFMGIWLAAIIIGKLFKLFKIYTLTPLLICIIGASTLAFVGLKMLIEMAKEDEGLEKRITEMREERIKLRRQEILNGEEAKI